MDKKAKLKISVQINQILKENEFYRIGGRWRKDGLHIGVQPNGLFSDKFDDKVAGLNFKKAIKDIKRLSGVQYAGSLEWLVGWKDYSGIICKIKLPA
jgi:predicted component of type VI protein secretion system